MARTTQLAIHLSAGSLSASDTVVRHVRGVEALSRPFTFDVEFEPPPDADPFELASLGGADALLTLQRPEGEARHVHGMLWSVEMHEVIAGRPRYRAQLVPRLLRLRHVRRSRVFQKLAVPEIVTQILNEGNVALRDDTVATHAPREYCLQYRESDLAFVERLLEDEGIFYFFEHTDSAHTLVLADDVAQCADLPGDTAVPFRVKVQSGDETELEHLSRLARARRVRSGKVTLRDYDFTRPDLALEGASKASTDGQLEDYGYPGHFTDDGAARTKLRLEELRTAAETVTGEGTCLRFVAGAQFEATEHLDDSLNQKLLLVRVEHEATQDFSAGSAGAMEHGYGNVFVARPADQPYRPRRRTPRPVACAETATVVGPAGEEIHPDEHGRIRVQFHWDREGQRDENASCWLHLAQQGWAGAGWGNSFVPRLGQEVFVRFLEGDPDRPVVLGALFNGQNVTPIPLPDEKTKSTLRTCSSLGGGGNNELRFEDRAGAEELFLHAQKDASAVVEHDDTEHVKRHQTLDVDANRDRSVGANQKLEVHKDDGSEIGKDQKLTVDGDRKTVVKGSHSEDVAASGSLSIGGARSISTVDSSDEETTLAATSTIGGDLKLAADGDLGNSVGLLFAITVGGDREEKIESAREETVGGAATRNFGADHSIEVEEGAALAMGDDTKDEIEGKADWKVEEAASWKAKSCTLEADKLSITVGDAKLVIDKQGNVKLTVGSLTVDGSSKVAMKGSSAALT